MSKEFHPYLLIWTGKNNRKFLLSSGESWAIGRDISNHCVIREKWVSRNHAIIEKTEDQQFRLTDLSNSNGSYINGKRVDGSTILEDKDKIVFGRTKVEFHHPAKNINNQVNNGINHSLFHQKSLLSVIIVELYEQELLENELDNNIFSMIVDDWFSQTQFIFYQQGILFNKSIGNSLIGIKFHQYKQPEKSELLNLFQAAADIYDMTSQLTDKYFLSFPLKIGITLNTGDAMVKTNKNNNHIDYNIFSNCIDICFYLKLAFQIIDKDLIIASKTYSYCSQLYLLNHLFKQYNNPLKYMDKNKFIYTTQLNKLVQVFQSNKINDFEQDLEENKGSLPDSVQDYLLTNNQSFPNGKIKTIVNLNSSLDLQLWQKKQLFNLLTSPAFIKKIKEQVNLEKIEFTQLVFEPLNYTNNHLSYSTNLCQEIDQEVEIYCQLEDYLIIDIPSNLIGKAQINSPSNLCAIYRKL